MERSTDELSMMLNNAHLLCYPRPSSLRRTSMYASFLGISGALHLGIFQHPVEQVFFSNLLDVYFDTLTIFIHEWK